MIFKKKQNALYITYKNIHYVRINRKFIYDNLIVKRPLMYKKRLGLISQSSRRSFLQVNHDKDASRSVKLTKMILHESH